MPWANSLEASYNANLAKINAEAKERDIERLKNDVLQYSDFLSVLPINDILIFVNRNADLFKRLNPHADNMKRSFLISTLSTNNIKNDIQCLQSAISILIELGANINAENSNNDTPLNIVAQENNYELCKFLITKGANPNCANRHGETPLEWAYTAKNKELMDLLIKNGADIFRPLSSGKSILETAVEEKDNENIVWLIYVHNASGKKIVLNDATLKFLIESNANLFNKVCQNIEIKDKDKLNKLIRGLVESGKKDEAAKLVKLL